MYFDVALSSECLIMMSPSVILFFFITKCLFTFGNETVFLQYDVDSNVYGYSDILAPVPNMKDDIQSASAFTS